MQPQELSRLYMEKYNELVNKFNELGIDALVENLNYAISKSDMAKTNELYNKVLEWNNKVANLEGAHIALNTQYRFLRLPSPASYGILFDGEERIWRFNTEAI